VSLHDLAGRTGAGVRWIGIDRRRREMGRGAGALEGVAQAVRPCGERTGLRLRDAVCSVAGGQRRDVVVRLHIVRFSKSQINRPVRYIRIRYASAHRRGTVGYLVRYCIRMRISPDLTTGHNPPWRWHVGLSSGLTLVSSELLRAAADCTLTSRHSSHPLRTGSSRPSVHGYTYTIRYVRDRRCLIIGIDVSPAVLRY
jgi:hypothetical protein